MEHYSTPYYIVYEDKLRKNLSLIKTVRERSGAEIIMAFKANALWKTFPIIREYVNGSTASSINEMKLSLEYLKGDVHAYCPVYTEKTFPEFLKGCSHISFNSLNQFIKFYPSVLQHNISDADKPVTCGIRINPRFSVVDTGIYDPSLPGSRFGVNAEDLPDKLPEGLEGFHFHALCESDSYDLEKILNVVEQKFGKWLPQIKWLNMGGGHLMTREGYDIDHLIGLLKDFRKKYPDLKIILEPGSAFTWQTGDLIVTILDVVEDNGIRTAIINASFACHMPDCLEMPYKPKIKEALDDNAPEGYVYRLGGNTCLSGDFVGNWKFEKELKPGDKLTLLDMNHYTTVKTNMFNGVDHPSILFKDSDGNDTLLRKFDYEDYKHRMD